MLVYNLRKYSNNDSKNLRSVQQFCRDQPALDNKGNFTDSSDNNNTTNLFKLKKIKCQTGEDGAVNIEIMLPMKF